MTPTTNTRGISRWLDPVLWAYRGPTYTGCLLEEGEMGEMLNKQVARAQTGKMGSEHPFLDVKLSMSGGLSYLALLYMTLTGERTL